MSDWRVWRERYDKLTREIEEEENRLSIELPELSQEVARLEKRITQKEHLIQDWQNLRPRVEKILRKLKPKRGWITIWAELTKPEYSEKELLRFIWGEGEESILDMSSDSWKSLSPDKQVTLAGKYQQAYAQYLEKELSLSEEIIREGKLLTHFEFVLVPPGRYEITKDKIITLRKGFYVGKYPVTQGQWQAVTGKNPARFLEIGEKAPVEQVSWNDVEEFLSRAEIQASGLRFLSETEWEYACRGGSTDLYCFGNDKSQLEKYAWYNENSSKTSQEVGGKIPNAYGIHDMHGNVREWCKDIYKNGYEHICKDGSAYIDNKDSSVRVSRGGSWSNSADNCSASYRSGRRPGGRYTDVGFRVARSISTAD